MYKKFFGLNSDPFAVNPDPRFLVLTRNAHEALASLTYGIQTRKGFLLLTGEVGTGKTTLVNRTLEWLRKQQVATAYVFNSSLNVPEFLDFMMADFGFDCQGMDKSRILMKLNNWLLSKYRQGQSAALIVDEAQNLSLEVLEEIRMLTNLETSTSKLLQIVLSGQPELEEKLRLPELRQLKQRIMLRCKTKPLTRDEVTEYITMRMRIAGASNVFATEAMDSIFAFSTGIPRVINLLCEHALIDAYVDQIKSIGPEIIERVAQDLEIGLHAVPAHSLDHSTPERAAFEELSRQFKTMEKRLKEVDAAKTSVAGGSK